MGLGKGRGGETGRELGFHTEQRIDGSLGSIMARGIPRGDGEKEVVSYTRARVGRDREGVSGWGVLNPFDHLLSVPSSSRGRSMSKTGAGTCAAYPAACLGSLDNAHQYAEKEKVGRRRLLQIPIHRLGIIPCLLVSLPGRTWIDV